MSGDVTPESRFLSRVKKTESCWLWQGATTTGYGRISLNNKDVLAHRVSYEMFVGKIPPGKLIDHLCFNRACVRPDHLRLVTQKQNSEHLQGANRNSTSGVRGVSWSKRYSRWRVQVCHSSHYVYGGLYGSLEEAERAAKELRSRLFTHDDAEGFSHE